jgi:hypothetical protein
MRGWAEQVADAVRAHVHAVDFPVGGLEDALGQVVADETVDAEDEDFFHGRPVGRRAAAVFRQQRAVHVVGRGDVEDGLRQHVAEVEAEHQVRLRGLDLRQQLGRFRVVRRDEGDAFGFAQRLHGLEPDVLGGAVLVGDDQGDIDAAGEQDFQAAHADVVVGEDDCAFGGLVMVVYVGRSDEPSSNLGSRLRGNDVAVQ